MIEILFAAVIALDTEAAFEGRARRDGVGLGKVSPKVPQADLAKVRRIAKQIADGGITNIPTELISAS